MVAERCFKKDMVWRRIIARRDRRVEADKKKILDNWSFLRICCARLSILKISWATGVGLSCGKLTSGAIIRMKTMSSDSACIRNAKHNKCGVRNWRRMNDILTKDVWWWILSEGNSPKDQMTLSKRWSRKDFYTKDRVLRRIIGRRGRRVEADKKKIWDNWGLLRICCAGLSILTISWATGVRLSWFVLRWKDNVRGYDSYEDHFFTFILCKKRGG